MCKVHWRAPRLSHHVASPLTEQELKGPGGKLGSAQQVYSKDGPESWHKFKALHSLNSKTKDGT